MRDSGVYYLQIRGTTYWFLKVYCEQEVADGGWTVSLLSKLNIYGLNNDNKIKIIKFHHLSKNEVKKMKEDHRCDFV